MRAGAIIVITHLVLMVIVLSVLLAGYASAFKECESELASERERANGLNHAIDHLLIDLVDLEEENAELREELNLPLPAAAELQP